VVRGTNAAVQITPQTHRRRARSYQFSLWTTRPATDVLHEFAERPLPGITVAERGANYLILRPQSRRRYGGDVAVVLAILIVLAVLILTAVTPVLVALLPLAVVPALPVLLDHRPDIAISAVPEDEAGARVTVHGLASAELAAALDAYLGSLPRYSPPAPSSVAGGPEAGAPTRTAG
jgi:hypothetical protein